jgi:hypothetical protein
MRACLLAPLALAIVALAPGIASAAVTTSQVTSPGDPYFGIFDGDLPAGDAANQITVSGTTNGTTGDQVNVRCFYGTYYGGVSSNLLASNVPVAADGSFSVSKPSNSSISRGRASTSRTSPPTRSPSRAPRRTRRTTTTSAPAA